jgi:hypothetical protein
MSKWSVSETEHTNVKLLTSFTHAACFFSTAALHPSSILKGKQQNGQKRATFAFE